MRTVLGIDGTRFTLNGKPEFLLGASYYGGLGASDEARRADFDKLQQRGFNWVRVWATWAAFGNDLSAVEPTTGEPRQPYLRTLQNLVSDCDRRGMVVDVTLSRGKTDAGPTRLPTHESHRQAVRTLVEALKPYRLTREGRWSEKLNYMGIGLTGRVSIKSATFHSDSWQA